MGAIAVIGLGAMGSAIAKALISDGHEVALWNRSPEKIDPLVELGGKKCKNLQEAIERSDVVLTCLLGYDVARTLLSPSPCARALSGKTLLQVSTGSPAEARQMEGFARACSALYLDGCIMDYPRAIGEAETFILLAGQREAFEICQPYLKSLAGDLKYLGEKVGSAAALDLALLTYDLGALLGILHAARICESEGVEVSLLGSLIGGVEEEEARYRAKVIAEADFANPQASVEVYDTILDRIIGQADSAGINKEIPSFTSQLFKRAMAAGMADEEAAALIKLLR